MSEILRGWIGTAAFELRHDFESWQVFAQAIEFRMITRIDIRMNIGIRLRFRFRFRLSVRHRFRN